MRIDLTTAGLANRQAAEKRAIELIAEMARTNDQTALLVFGDNIATVSWLDGFLFTMLSSNRVHAQVVVMTSFEDTREHVELALRRRNLAVLAAFDGASLSAGDVTALGAVSEANNEALVLVREAGEILVAELAARLCISIEAAQQRLNALLELRLIERTKVGKAYVYQLPRIETRELASA
jgi:hypothetical protein